MAHDVVLMKRNTPRTKNRPANAPKALAAGLAQITAKTVSVVRRTAKAVDVEVTAKTVSAARFAAVSLAAITMTGCSIPIDDQLWQCETSADCGSGWQCDPVGRYCVQAYQGANGVFDDRLVIGTTAYLSEDIPSLAVIGQQGLAGIQAYFNHVNSTGGIHGRQLVLRALDDNFDPAQATANFEQLAGAGDRERQAFLVCNTFGDPSSIAAAQVAVREKVLLWSPGTGSDSLEPDPPTRYVFNYRPRYSDEARQLTEYLTTLVDPVVPANNVAVVAQGVDFVGTLSDNGTNVINGVARSLGIAPNSVFYASYVLGSADGREPARNILKWMASEDRVVSEGERRIGLVLGTVFDAGASVISNILDQLSAARRGQPLSPGFVDDFDAAEVQRLATVDLELTAQSAITTNALRATLASFGTYPWFDDQGQPVQRAYGAGIVISQVVPFAESDSSGAIRYREHLNAYDPMIPPGEFSLESYLNMWLLGEALQAHGPDLTTETFIETLEGFSTDLGVGTMLGFSIGSHQATDRVWAIRLDEQLSPEWLGLLLPVE